MHLQAEAKISSSTVVCFMCLLCSSGAVSKACLEAMNELGIRMGLPVFLRGETKGLSPLVQRERHLLISSHKAASVAIEMEEKDRGSQM